MLTQDAHLFANGFHTSAHSGVHDVGTLPLPPHALSISLAMGLSIFSHSSSVSKGASWGGGGGGDGGHGVGAPASFGARVMGGSDFCIHSLVKSSISPPHIELI